MVFSSVSDNVQKYKILAGIIRKKPISGPYSVHLDLTNHCNNDCISCWSFSPLVGFKTMDAATRKKQLPAKLVQKLIKELSEMGVREIYFTGGGEPFMHPDALELMELVKRKGMKCDMSTNFTLVDKEKALRMVKAGIDHINCSIWAGTPEAYEATHPNKSAKAFEKIIRMLEFFAETKKAKISKTPIITLYNVISTRNFQDFNSMAELAFKVKADCVNFTPTDIVPGMTDSLMLNKEQASGLLEDIRSVWKKIEDWEKHYKHKIIFRDYETLVRRIGSLSGEKGIYDSGFIGKIPCYAGFNFLRILATGEVNSCLKSGRIPIGNIHERSIKDIWMSSRQQEFRRHTIDYEVNDPFFKNIGNTTQTGNGCLFCCDNVGWNMIFHNEMERLSPTKRQLLSMAKHLP